MSIRKGFLSKRVYLSWMLSYTIVLIVTIGIFLIVYTQIERIVSAELSSSNVSLLRQVQQSMDSQFADMQRLSLEIALNKKLVSMQETSGILNAKSRFTLYEIVNDLATYKAVNGFADMFFVYLKRSDTVFTPTSAGDQTTFLTLLEAGYGINRAQWNQMIQAQKPEYLSMQIINNQRANVRDIVYIQPIPIGKSVENLGTIIVMLNESRFQGVIAAIGRNSTSKFIILNENNEVIAETQPGSETSGVIRYGDLNSDWGILRKNLDGQQMVVTYVTSAVTGWKYVSVLHVDTYMAQVSSARQMTILGGIACLLVGGLLSFFFLKRNYNPISAIIQTLEKRLGIKVDRRHNEYSFIQETIQNTIDEKSVADSRLRQQNAAMRANFFSRLLTGKLSKSYTIDELLKSYEIQFVSNCFAVILLYIEDCSRLFAGERIAENTGDMRALYAILSSVFEELANQKNRGYMAEIDDMQACLVNFRDCEGLDAERELLELGSEMQRILEEKFNIYLSISVSDIHQSLEAIPTAYSEAMEALEYRNVDDNKKIYSYREVTKYSPNSYDFSKLSEQQLVNFIKTGNYPDAKKVVDEIFSEYLSNKSCSMKIVKFLSFDLINAVLKAMMSISTDSQNYFFSELSPLDKIQKCETLKDIKAQITSTVHDACDYVDRKKRSHNDIMKDNLVQFIHINYSDMNLNVHMVANKFEMNPVYISRFAKEQLGDSLLDYINKVRLEKAKQLMKSGRLSAADIAIKTGYCNISTFIRVFKKYEGMTPGQFKKEYH
jgi:two-component system, response regulator YesN